MIGICGALSSTAVVIQSLSSTELSHTTFGKASLAILVIQDVYLCLILAIFPVLHMSKAVVAMSLAQRLAALISLVFTSQYLFRSFLPNLYVFVRLLQWKFLVSKRDKAGKSAILPRTLTRKNSDNLSDSEDHFDLIDESDDESAATADAVDMSTPLFALDWFFPGHDEGDDERKRSFRKWLARSTWRMNGKNQWMVIGLLTCFAMGQISHKLGLSIELGSFLAGVLLTIEFPAWALAVRRRSSGRRQQKSPVPEYDSPSKCILDRIQIISNFLAIPFFATIGFHVYPPFLVSNWKLLLSLSAIFWIVKTLVLWVILVGGFRFRASAAFLVSVTLAQISEFVFVLASRAKAWGMISREEYYLMVGLTALSLLGFPLTWRLIRFALVDNRSFHTS